MSQSIPASQIVGSTPSVLGAGGTALALNGMVLTTSTRVPIGTAMSFPSQTAVGNFFGLASPQYTRSGAYFNGFTNGTITPDALLFTQYNQVAVNAYLRGGSLSALTLAQLQAISGVLTVTINGTAVTSTNISLTGATSFSNAAQIINTALGAPSGPNATFTGVIASSVLTASGVSGIIAVGEIISGGTVTAGTYIASQLSGTVGGAGTYSVVGTVTAASAALTSTYPAVSYDSITGAFVVSSSTTGAASTISAATGTVAQALGLTTVAGAVASQGAAAAAPAAFMAALIQVTSNWGFFTTDFDPDLPAGSGNTVKQVFAAWTNSTDDRYGYVAWETDVSGEAQVPATSSLGYILQQSNSSGTIPICAPINQAMIGYAVLGFFASLNWNATNGRTTLAETSFTGLPADVLSATAAANLTANGYNFYGGYAEAANSWIFMMPGSISGPFKWADSYANQIYMNSQFRTALMNLLTTVGSIPYNYAGLAMIENTLVGSPNAPAVLGPILAAVDFGTIDTGVQLSSAQVVALNAAAGGVNIAQTIQTQGWYLQVLLGTAQTRVARTTPPITFSYADGGRIQTMNVASVEVQ